MQQRTGRRSKVPEIKDYCKKCGLCKEHPPLFQCERNGTWMVEYARCRILDKYREGAEAPFPFLHLGRLCQGVAKVVESLQPIQDVRKLASRDSFHYDYVFDAILRLDDALMKFNKRLGAIPRREGGDCDDADIPLVVLAEHWRAVLGALRALYEANECSYAPMRDMQQGFIECDRAMKPDDPRKQALAGIIKLNALGSEIGAVADIMLRSEYTRIDELAAKLNGLRKEESISGSKISDNGLLAEVKKMIKSGEYNSYREIAEALARKNRWGGEARIRKAIKEYADYGYIDRRLGKPGPKP